MTAVARLGFESQNSAFLRAIAMGEEWADWDAVPADVDAVSSVLRRQLPARGSVGWDCTTLAQTALQYHPDLEINNFLRATQDVFADAYRELFPNPFLALTWNPNWLTSTVRDVAAHIYESREFSAMPILADALQDADCNDEQILNHCRGNRPHARGCWVLDAILGKT